MSRVHPLKRIQVAAAAFAVLGLALAAAAEPLTMVGPASDAIVLPLASRPARTTTRPPRHRVAPGATSCRR